MIAKSMPAVAPSVSISYPIEGFFFPDKLRAELNTKTGSLCDQTLDRRQAGAGCYSSTSCVSTRPQSSHLNVRSSGRPPNFGVILATVMRAPQAGQSGGKSFAFGGVGSSGAIKQKSTRQRLMI